LPVLPRNRKEIERLQTIEIVFKKWFAQTGALIYWTKHNNLDYLQSRFSKQILFSFNAPQTTNMVMLNPIFYSWTIEI
jgi:hypothetical protein